MRRTSMGCIAASVMVGIAIGAASSVMLSDCKGMKSTKRHARRALSAVEDMLISMKDMVF